MREPGGVASRPRRVTPRALLLLTLCAVAACGGGVASTADGGPVRYEVTALVLESPEHGPELCVGGVAQSLPPQCGGVTVLGWDWAAVEGEESANGTTWGGDYRVVGTFDGTALTLTEPPRPAEPQRPVDRLGPACPEPPGGWTAPDPARTDDGALQAAMRVALAHPEHAGLWVSGDGPGTEAPEQRVLNVALAADPAAHEAELRAQWGGPLCVVRQERRLEELRRIQEALSTVAPELGLSLTGTSVDVTRGVVELGVVAVDDAQQAALDDRYGAGVVEVTPALRPLPG